MPRDKAVKRVIVTGASGLIGRAAVPALRDRGFEVHAVGRHAAPVDLQPGLTWHRCDLQAEEPGRLVREVGASHLLHLAWVPATDGIYASRENRAWIGVSASLIESFVAMGGTRVVAAGSSAEYDWSEGGTFHEATSRVEPRTPYGAAKRELWTQASRLAGSAGITLSWPRIFNVYGPWEPVHRLVPSITRGLLERRPVACSEGAQVRDYLYVDDVGRALAALLDSEHHGVINIGSGVATPVRDVIAEIGRCVGRPELIRWGAIPGRPTEPAEIVAATENLRAALSWRPLVDLSSGIERTVAWWRAQSW